MCVYSHIQAVKNTKICQMVPLYGSRGGLVVKALRHKPGGRGFNSRCCHKNFSVT